MSLIGNDNLNAKKGEEQQSLPPLAEGAEASPCPGCGSPIFLELRYEKLLFCAQCAPPSVHSLCDRSWHVLVDVASGIRYWQIRDRHDGLPIGVVTLFGQEPATEEEPAPENKRARRPLDPITFEWDAWSKPEWGLARSGDGGEAWQESIRRYAREEM